jgi:hypothetical protein
MKNPLAAVVATAIPLLATSLPVSAGELLSNEPARLHWSAAIGTGYAARATVANPEVTNSGATAASATSPSHGVPASPHWTARIGTGTAASATAIPDANRTSLSGTQPVVAAAHWTSRIGTGHSSDSTSAVTHASLNNGG